MTTKYTVIVCVLMACGATDKNVNINNDAPEAVITSHTDGDVIFTDTPIEFRATVSDTTDSPLDLEVQWSVSGRVVCPFAVPDENGLSTCTASVLEGEDTLQVEVRDPQNATGTDAVLLDVQISNAPIAEIIDPIANGVFYSDVLITFSGQVSDAEESPVNLQTYWESSNTGVLSLDSTPDSGGLFTDFGFLPPGEHGITLHVQDSSGKTSSDSVTITVNENNSPPYCDILSPQTGTSGELGALVIFEGSVGDVDIPFSDLGVAWSSDKDGPIGNSNPNSDGEVSFPFSDLSINTHVVSMTVSDEVGAECVADVIYTVGSPPTLTLTAPTANSTFTAGESISFIAEVTDNEDSPSQISVDWVSSLDGLFSSTGPSSNSIAQFSTSSLSNGTHSITVTATDSDGLYADALLDITIYGVPSQPTVSLSPDPAYTTDDLLAIGSGSVDPDGDPVSYIYEWYLNGVNSGLIGSTLPQASTAKSQTWTVRVTPTDGIVNGDYEEASVTILNSPPEMQSVAISPNQPSTQDTLTCAASAFDADGDPVTLDYQWLEGNNVLSSTTDTLSGPFVQGTTLTCRVTPDDATIIGTSAEDSVTIGNTPPLLSAITFSPSVVYTDNILTATVTASDADGDSLTYNWEWSVDSGNGPQVVLTNSGSLITDTLDGVFYFDRDDSISLWVEAFDGSDSVSLLSSDVTVLNTAPSVFNVQISPAAPVAGVDDLSCLAQSSDADGDLVSLTYSWTVDGLATTYTTNTIPSADISDAEVWICVVTPNDGTIDGTPDSALVVIGANSIGATGGGFCASAGESTDANGFVSHSCLSEAGIAGVPSNDTATNTWQPGTIYLFSPE